MIFKFIDWILYIIQRLKFTNEIPYSQTHEKDQLEVASNKVGGSEIDWMNYRQKNRMYKDKTPQLLLEIYMLLFGWSEEYISMLGHHEKCD